MNMQEYENIKEHKRIEEQTNKQANKQTNTQTRGIQKDIKEYEGI